MEKRLLIVSIIVLSAVFVYSGHISVQQARQVAKTVASEQNLRGGVLDDSVFIESLNEIDLIYVVKFSPVGFVLISADDRIVPILGYSFESDYEEGKIPPQLLELLEQWKTEIQLTIEESAPENMRTMEQWRNLQTTRHQRNNRTVLPLMATNWDQGYPWNQYCPSDEDGPGDHVWAGCVAVSMAQVMKYWNYPDIGVGSHSYYHVDYGTLSADFGETEYDFASMLNNSANPAVKTLLLHCGVAVEMDYGPDGSGAYVGSGYPNAAQALRTRFAYEQNLEFYEKFQFEETEWAEMLRTELDEGRPVIYRGVGGDVGHAWNIDGYQDSSYFHCNWGWSGYYNGYFYLDDLTPGFGSNFSGSQGMIAGIQPIPTDVPAISLNPVSLNFEEVALGSSVSKTIEILSVGSQTLELLLLNIVGEYADQFEITDEIDDFILLPGESENIEITFTPIEANTVFAIFQVESDSYENSLKTAMMTATGFVPDGPVMNISNSIIDFGEVQIYEEKLDSIFISNVGSETLIFNNVNISQDEDAFFVDSLCWTEIEPGGECFFYVTFQPSATSEYAAVISLETNNILGEICNIELFGSGNISGLKGDVNFDGMINVLDVIQVVNYIMGFVEPNENQFWASDMNDDTIINVLDVIEIVNLALNL